MTLKVFRPLQVGFNSRVLEQDRKFHFIASATLGINLQTGASILETDFLKDSFEAMGTTSLPDMGMPKPNGEVLLSGKCFAPNRSPVQGCPVSLRVGTIDKTLYVFGDRFWKPGLVLKDMTEPAPFAEMPLAFDRAFGGEGFAPNPSGKGFAPIKSQDGLHPLPNIEDPKHLIGLAGDRPAPVGFGTLDPAWPQRMRFSGTYDANYKTNYFPGYPADHDWRYFLCAPEDQWNPDFFRGDEDFALSHLHPDLPQVAGKLPGFYPRCFILRERKELPPAFLELPLNLDTIWFFPEKLLALLIFRRGVEVEDDEGEKITHAILGYEDRAQQPRDPEHYRRALDRRLTSQDAMLNIFNTSDLIPDGHKCAMEIFMEQALGGAPKSEFGKNLDAKVEGIRKMVDEKVEEAIAKTEKGLDGIAVPADVKAQMPDGGKLDLRAMMNRKPDKPDAEVQALNGKLDSILPGITAGDVKKIDMKQFSFSKVEEMMAAVSGFTDRKEKDAKNLAKVELGKAQDQLRGKLTSTKATGNLPPESQASLEESLKTLEAVDLDAPRVAALPRLNAEEIIASLDSVNPQVFAALQHLQAMKQAGVHDERTQTLEKEIHETMEREMSRTTEALRQAEKDFKGIYLTSAQFLSDGTSPHKATVEKITEKFQAALAEFRPVAQGDWACIDLSGCKLDGIDLSGAYLEQVNFRGASLRGANLRGQVGRQVHVKQEFHDWASGISCSSERHAA